MNKSIILYAYPQLIVFEDEVNTLGQTRRQFFPAPRREVEKAFLNIAQKMGFGKYPDDEWRVELVDNKTYMVVTRSDFERREEITFSHVFHTVCMGGSDD